MIEKSNLGQNGPLVSRLGYGAMVLEGFYGASNDSSAVDTLTHAIEMGMMIDSADAYGAHDPNGRQSFPRDKVPDDIPLEIGTRLQLSGPQGQPIMVTIAEVSDDAIILDANHPLAGKDLTFQIELVEIV